jgi:enoyl-CoA hydratase/carnithine racemase
VPTSVEAGGLISDLSDAGALGLDIVEVDEGARLAPSTADGVVRVAVHRSGAAPRTGPEAFDILLSADPDAPAPWVGFAAAALEDALAQLVGVIDRQPLAAAVAAQVHRMTLKLDFEQALVLESLAYSMLLASEGFKTWRASTPVRTRQDDPEPRVQLSREAGVLCIRLTRPGGRNAVDARMRDELVEALNFALIDPDAAPTLLFGEGVNFSSGGDLDTFGQASDPGQAHAIRVLQSAARLVHQLGERMTARLHGACVGAGIEVPAAAHRAVARPGASFRLPEVSMGLIPGAGGTASIPRRIGRQRACYLAISGWTLDLETALAWGLVDAVDDGP